MRVAWVVLFLATWLIGGQASASGLPLALDFEDSARDLPQQEIRTAIEQELAEAGAAGGAVATAEGERVIIALDGQGQLWVKYQGPRGLVERQLPVPERADQIPVVISLAVGNLVRQEAFEVLRELERQRAERLKDEQASAAQDEAKRRAFADEPKPVPKPRAPVAKSTWRRNSWGAYYLTDFFYFGAVHGVCTTRSSDRDVTCYADSRPYEYAQPAGTEAGSGVAGGLVIGATRLGIAYARKLTPFYAVSVRTGMAVAKAGVVPWFVEVGQRIYMVPGWAGGAVQPFSQLGLGALWSQVSVPVVVQEVDETGMFTRQQAARAIRRSGWGFGSLGAGLSGALSDQWRLEVELSLMFTFPAGDVAVPTVVGLRYEF